MLEKRSEVEAVRALWDSDLREACDRARELVAKDPADEPAAGLLKETVERFASEEPNIRVEMPADAPLVAEARRLISDGQLEEAELLLRRHLDTARHDPAAMHLMAEIAAGCGFLEDAERILMKSAELHSSSPEAWVSLGMTLYRIACEHDLPHFVPRAVSALDQALVCDPDYEPALTSKSIVLMQTRALDLARLVLERLTSIRSCDPGHWVNYAYLLKTLGESGHAVAAYRTALALDPTNGFAWWSLANVRTAKFFAADRSIMEAALQSPKLPNDARIEISFALARAFDQSKQYEQAAQRLIEANRIRNECPTNEVNILGVGAEFTRSLYTRPFFEKRRGWGDQRPDPIFIVGLPRAGSTLVEQILASHPMIEGTEELFAMHQLECALGRREPGKPARELVEALTEDEFERLGSRYLELASRSRNTDRPFFTDKNPANWRYSGFIHCMLPNAKIIDVRRNPMDCCFANYAQHYAIGMNFSYDQQQLGEVYADYIQTMRHFDEALPGRIHRVIHDDLVDDVEREVRRLLDYLGLPFDERCLRFFELDRPVHTPSAEQVRQPINRDGFGRWRNYEPWLADLKKSLGGIINNWRT